MPDDLRWYEEAMLNEQYGDDDEADEHCTGCNRPARYCICDADDDVE